MKQKLTAVSMAVESTTPFAESVVYYLVVSLTR